MTTTATDDKLAATLNAGPCHTVPWCEVRPGRHQHDQADQAACHVRHLGDHVQLVQYERAGGTLEGAFVELDPDTVEMHDPADCEQVAENLTIAAGILRAALA